MKSLAFRPDHQNGCTPTVGKKMPVHFFGGLRLAHLIGVARTLEMPLEGRMYSMQQAHQMGLADRLGPR
jgi:enoyl-CoA hydratase/carnithine racemase